MMICNVNSALTVISIPPRGRSGKRPGVLSPEEVERVITAPPNLKHRALLAMTYGSGLRASQVLSVQPRHSDRGRLMRVVTGNGGNGILPPKLIWVG